jgi:tRNA A-37 threonylcarbamoyl transferase component Bud32
VNEQDKQPLGEPDGLDGIIERFEGAWQQGNWPVLEEYLPAAGPQRGPVLIELVHTDLEWRLKAGVVVRVESYLARYPELAADPSVALDLIAAEHELRRRGETDLSLENYRERFPQYGEELAARLRASARSLGGPDRPAYRDAPLAGGGPADPPIDSVAVLVGLLDAYQLLPGAQRDELGTFQGAFNEPQALARELLQRGWLTPLQINRLFQGRGRELRLGPYSFLERLGSGGMGQVFKARHDDLDQLVAVKILRNDLMRHPLAVRRFRREIRALIQLAHPHIVMALDTGEIHQVHYFAMEYVEGIDLGRLLNQFGRLAIGKAGDYARQAALGLRHAHERGLIHRDVKPSNLILRLEDGVVKLLDLGLARLILLPEGGEHSSTLTKEGAVVGTPDYMAPEQVLNAHGADARCDLYSLGCTLYHMLTGCTPFPGKNMAEKLLKQQVAQPRPVEELRQDTPAELAAIVRKLMAKEPEERFRTAAAAASALAAFGERR